jgi:aminoglycoside phosphotransferase (APT) family kinase protein
MLDALRFAGRLGAELGRIALGRLVPGADAVPRTVEDVDARWIARALSGRFPEASVAGVRTLSEDRGTTARRRVAVEYTRGDAASGAPASVFVKVRPPRLTEQLFGRLFNLGATEVSFYRDARPVLPIRAPDCYAAQLGKGGEFAIMLEDLDRDGVELATIADEVSLSRAEAVVDALAALHATFWGEPRFAWLRTGAANPNSAVERFICARAHRPTLARFSHLLPERLRERAHRIHAERRALERYWADAPSTLVHGDAHVGNMFFEHGEAGLFDWQVTQHHQGIRDVAYFMVLSLETELRRVHERDLIRHYQERLLSLGVPTIEASFDRLWEHYRSFSLYAYIATSVTATMSDLQPAHIAELGLRRAAVAVDDLDALHLLDRIV